MGAETSVQALVQGLWGVLSQVAEPQTVLQTILRQAMARTGADGGVMVEVDKNGHPDESALYRFDQNVLREGASDFSRSIIRAVARSREAEIIADTSGDRRFAQSASVSDLRLVSVLCTPLIVEGRLVAVVYLEKNRASHFTREHAELLNSLSAVAGPVLGALRAGRQILAERDEIRESARRVREELDESREILSRDWSFRRFLGRSDQVRTLASLVRRAAAVEFPVLIMGETGTGKSLLAQVIHACSKRAKQHFQPVFCPSLPREMVEATLFGHKRGAFTGAIQDRQGYVQAAEKGTLFLDEVGELPPEIQPKLLRLLHERTYERVGDNREVSADVRILAATNKQLEHEIAAGRFREDLYQRLNFVPIRIPPLRERREDIPLLLRHALDQTELGRWIQLEPDGEECLMELEYDWPGNVREIGQLAARFVMQEAKSIRRVDLERIIDLQRTVRRRVHDDAPPPTTPSGIKTSVENHEKQLLEQLLQENPRLTRKQLARKAGMSERTLYDKLKKHGLGSAL